jgi:dienelactone hydrolase
MPKPTKAVRFDARDARATTPQRSSPPMEEVATFLRERLQLATPGPVDVQRGNVEAFDGFRRERIGYRGLEGDRIPAFLFTPNGRAALGGVVVFHQHDGEFHFGKSEVAGLVGDPFQAFGPALARRGLAVLAPDAITFEDRRASVQGTEPDLYDWLQHYNAMSYRLLQGDLLMRKCLDGAQRALSVLLQTNGVDAHRVGVAGHSYGGTTALYHAAVDARCRFACISGAVCSFGTRLREGTGIQLFETVPGLSRQLGHHDLLAAIGPRPAMVVSGTQHKYSRDADQVVAKVAGGFITELRVERGHALEQERSEAMVAWIVWRACEQADA